MATDYANAFLICTIQLPVTSYPQCNSSEKDISFALSDCSTVFETHLIQSTEPGNEIAIKYSHIEKKATSVNNTQVERII